MQACQKKSMGTIFLLPIWVSCIRHWHRSATHPGAQLLKFKEQHHTGQLSAKAARTTGHRSVYAYVRTDSITNRQCLFVTVYFSLALGCQLFVSRYSQPASLTRARLLFNASPSQGRHFSWT